MPPIFRPPSFGKLKGSHRLVKVATEMERFFKYHGLGNDFVVLDRRQTGQDLSAEAARRLCDRRRGIGADGALVLLPAAGASARMVVHNADGSEAEMCGNGIRCVVKHLVDHGRERPDRVPIETAAGIISCAVRYTGGKVDEVEVSMGPAQSIADELPSASGQPFFKRELPGFPGVVGTAVSMGNPHLVLMDRPLEEAPTLGPKLERATGFKDRTNVEFVRVQSRGLKVVVWERGSGLTQACGTGACASVAVAVREGRLPAEEWIGVELPGGMLHIRAEADLSQLLLRGPATFVYEGALP